MDKKILLIDGHSIMNRAFYGVPDLTNVNGLHTNAVYGFLNILFRFLDEEKPDYLAIAFDLHAPTFRHKLYDAYKGTRKGMPDELREQVPYIKKLVKEMNIKTLELEGYEADDLLGTMAKKAQKEGIEVSLLSGDRDLLQIADEHIKIRIPKTIKGQTTVEDYYPADVYAKYNVTPEEFIHMKALMGDSSDNIPGVPKVGEKTAAELIVTYHSLDKIYESLSEISKNAIRTSLEENRDLAYLCLKLTTIEINAPIEFDKEELKNVITYSEGGYNILKELGLKTYIKKFEDNMTAEVNEAEFDEPEINVIDSNDKILSLFDNIKQEKDTAFIKGMFGSMIKYADNYSFVPNTVDIYSLIKKIVFESDTLLTVHKASDVYELLSDDDLNVISKKITDKIFALDIASYIVNPLNNSYTIDGMLSDYLGLSVQSESVSEKDLAKVVYGFGKLKNELNERLIESGQKDLYTDIEMPLSLVLFEMEKTGIKVNKGDLKKYGEDLSLSIEVL